MKVYILIGSYHYEGSDTIIGVWADPVKAEAECRRLKAHRDSEPPISQDMSDEQIVQWNVACDEWRKGLHNGQSLDAYFVEEKEVIP